jgi:hypothetical protein
VSVVQHLYHFQMPQAQGGKGLDIFFEVESLQGNAHLAVAVVQSQTIFHNGDSPRIDRLRLPAEQVPAGSVLVVIVHVTRATLYTLHIEGLNSGQVAAGEDIKVAPFPLFFMHCMVAL